MKTGLLLSLLAVVTVGGCAQKRNQPVARTAPKSALTALPTFMTEEPPTPAPDAPREKRPRFGASAVYVDGKPIGVVQASELPATLKSRSVDLGGGTHSNRYSMLAYLREMKVDTARIKGLHLYGGNRVSLIDQAEFARIGDRLMISFTGGDHGKPRIHYPSVKLTTNTTIDMLTNIAVYIDKVPPTLNADRELVMPDGTLAEGKVPYAPEEQGNGTRVYVDGTLVGAVKRKKLTQAMILPTLASDTVSAKTAKTETAVDHFGLLSYAGMLRADALRAKTVDLVAGDDCVARITDVTTLGFNVPQHNRGQAVVDVPTNGGLRAARISAIQIYVNTMPPPRSFVAIDDAPQAALGGGGGGGQGPSSDDE